MHARRRLLIVPSQVLKRFGLGTERIGWSTRRSQRGPSVLRIRALKRLAPKACRICVLGNRSTTVCSGGQWLAPDVEMNFERPEIADMISSLYSRCTKNTKSFLCTTRVRSKGAEVWYDTRAIEMWTNKRNEHDVNNTTVTILQAGIFTELASHDSVSGMQFTGWRRLASRGHSEGI